MGTQGEQVRSLLDDLRRPEAYPAPRPSQVTQVTTHISSVFLTDREVWKLKRPVGYRNWVYVGEVVTPNDMNDGEATFPEFHSVYMDPESFAEYEKTGKYRDGTVLVKELSSVGSKKAPSGNGYFQGEFTGLEATIKDSKRFKDEPGNWAYFSFGHKYPLKAEVSKNAVAACNQCHQDNAQKDDWVFSQYYPVLRAAASRSR